MHGGSLAPGGDVAVCRRGETFFIRVFLVGVVRRYAAYAGDVAEVVRLLATGPEFSASMSFGSLAVLVVGVFVGAVSERHQPERDVLGFLAVGVVRKDVADEARLVPSCFLKECWLWVHVGGRCAQSRCRGLVGVGGCPGGMPVGQDSVLN